MHMHASVLLLSKAPCGLEHETLRETGILLIWLDATELFTGEKLRIFSSGCHEFHYFVSTERRDVWMGRALPACIEIQ